MRRSQLRYSNTGHPGPFVSLAWLCLSVVIPLTFSVSHLTDDLWYDEAVTVGMFASRPVSEIVTSYPFPNNHVLFSILLRPFCLFAEEPFSLRMLPLLCTLVTLCAVFATGTRWGGVPVASCTVGVLGCNQVFLNYCMQVRGYTLSTCLMAILLWLLAAHPSERSGKRFCAVLVSVWAFVYTLPTNLAFAVAGGIADMIIAGNVTRRYSTTILAGVPWAVGCLAAAISYMPIMDELRAIGATSVFSVTHLTETFVAFFFDLCRDQWWLAALTIAVGTRAWVRQRDRRLDWRLICLVSCLAIPWLVFLSLQAVPFARNFVPVLPVFALAAGWAVVRFWRSAIKMALPRYSSSDGLVAALSLALIAVVSLPQLQSFETRMHQHLLTGNNESTYFVHTRCQFSPAYVVNMVRNVAAERKHYLLLFSDRDQMSLGYYLSRIELPFMFLPPDIESEAPVELFLVASGPPDYPALAEKSGLSTDWLKSLPIVEDTGYFQIYRPAAAVPVSNLKQLTQL
ncbi:MAG: hypothetical protein MK102_04690 [Fuerstiella sp.]|nr:hypothetical protein [Fuerstiella sp.]